MQVNRTPVQSALDAGEKLEEVPIGQAAFVLVWRRGQEVFLTIPREE